MEHVALGTATVECVGTGEGWACIERREEGAGFEEQGRQFAAWHTIPSWALVATGDNAIGTANVRFMAQRATTNVVEVNASHVAMISHPGAVVDLIRAADRATN